MTRSSGPALLAVLLLSAALPAAPPDGDAAALLARIKAVKAEGEGNADAAAAWKQLVALGPDALLPSLAAMTDRGLVANNWLRAAVDAIAEQAVKKGAPLPVKELEAFIADRKNSGVARRLAYEWLCRLDKQAPDRLLPGMLDDPGSELRRDAVAVVITEGDACVKEKDNDGAILAYRKAFEAARDTDQVDQLAQKLDKLGVKVDVMAHYGLIPRWHIVGPFDNTRGAGFARVYPPEEVVDLTKTYKGKNGGDVKWTVRTAETVAKPNAPPGFVDLNKVYEDKPKETVAYAYVVIESPRDQKVQLRAGTKNAVKIFLNGKQVFARDEYHHTVTMLDNHVAEGVLKQGRNEILMKVCQNEQKEAWTVQWEFLLRLCDDLGGGVPFKVISPDRKEGQ